MPQKKSPAKAQAGKTALHYRLTNDEWLDAVHNLKPSERDLLYHLRTLDPFGDRTLDLTVTSLATTLGVNKSTISRALKVLGRKGYIDLEVLAVRVKLRTCGLEATVLPSNNSVASKQPVFPQNNQKDPVATEVVLSQQDRSLSNMQSLNTLLEGVSELPQTLHPNQTDQTSLKEEKENSIFLFEEDGEPIAIFREWLVQTMNKLPTRPTYPERWIEVNAAKPSVQKDFINYKNSLDRRDALISAAEYVNSSGVGVAHHHADFDPNTPENIYARTLASCKHNLFFGRRGKILPKLQQIWDSGWIDICTRICEELPDCGVRVGENGMEQVQQKDEAG